ncbi:hypothetical protein KDN24_06685 [Bacillus sp. Bva_UNVM-123]|uniref:hypothetical protein n=1 Tax=Bacillus sp. Bva_UNVM-123 TaxID=2829798 RepID=UPI00391F3A00
MSKLDEVKEELKELNTFEYLCGGQCIISLDSYDWLIEQAEKNYTYEKALEEITRQYDFTNVNRAKEIANEALGELTDERRREIQGYRKLINDSFI